MKPKSTIILLTFCFLISNFTFAQEIKPYRYYIENNQKSENLSPDVLPDDVQNAYDVKWYFINLNAENNTVALSGDVTIKAEVVKHIMDTLCLYLHQDYTIDSILIDGVKKNFINESYKRMVIDLDIPQNTLFDVQVFYHGEFNGSGGFFSGISTERDQRYGSFDVTWTLSEANNAYHWFPVKQVLTDKADSCWVFITTTKPNMVASNGLLTDVVDLPNNKIRYEWKSNYPIAYYLISIAIAEYQDYSIYAEIPQTGEQLLIQNYIYNSTQCLDQNKGAIDETAEMIEYFSEIFGAYPFSSEKYGHSLAYMGGAMEHQTMTTTGYFYDGIIAHELVHQWFGDNVTCASWQHIWLNEGFASYGEYLWYEYKYGRQTAFTQFRQYVIFSVINYGKTGSVYVPIEHIDNENRIFDGTLTYDKGAILVHMLRYELGDDDDLFFNILQTYQERFKDNAAVIDDFIGVVEELSDMDFTTFVDQWFYGEGYPMFNISWHQSGNQLTLNSTQTTTASNITPLFKVTYELKINYSDGSNEIVPFYHDETTKQFVYSIPDGKTISSINFDPNYWLLATASVVFNPVGIGNFSNDKDIIVYPNPSSNIINIKFDQTLQCEKDIFISDLNGKVIQKIKTYADFCTINIDNLPTGTYLLSVHSETDVFMRKIIKSNN